MKWKPLLSSNLIYIASTALILSSRVRYEVDGFSSISFFHRSIPLGTENTSFKLSSSFSSQDNDKNEEGNNNDFMDSLRKRIDQVNDSATKLPLVVLDSMLPRQVLEVQVNNKLFMELIRSRLIEEEPKFGMLGMARLATGEYVHLKDGVEVQVVGTPEIKGNGIDGGAIKLKLRGLRRFRIEGGVQNAEEGWTEARVKFLDSKEQESKEESEGGDRLALARAINKARAFTDSNTMYVEDKDLVLVDRWIQLAKENEREKGQIDRLLEDLGEIPPMDQPSERAFWIGALINPIPAMGVAMEIRPALLTAKTAEERVQVAFDGILRSIKHMDGTKRMW